MGGEEFMLFLPRASADLALSVAKALPQAATTIENLLVRPTATLGVVSLATQADLQDAFRRADMALYEAKNAG
ncbi:diguanylate cyclase [Ligilactobacillus salivarius]|uniref:diguanylate cyclase n=1 Tax=Ligilactobacillus salivarius TaxID=1624 RepID=UPI003C111B6D